MTFRTRFAPSPTGPLHLGHAYSAMLAHDMAMARGGEFHLRIDDLDQSRARPEWEVRLKDDLTWLGLTWTEPCRRESEHLDDYAAALDKLWDMGLLYRCTCTRRDIREALAAPQEGVPSEGPDGLVYPRTCAHHGARGGAEFARQSRPKGVTLRLDMTRAIEMGQGTQQPLFRHRIDTSEGTVSRAAAMQETGAGPTGKTGLIEFTDTEMQTDIGDVVLSRNTVGAAYHLAVVVDDAAQGITHVIRGQDLFESTKIHVFLQRLLGLFSPTYHHHALIRDDTGKRLAKRDDARAITTYRIEGATPADIRRMVGLSPPPAP